MDRGNSGGINEMNSNEYSFEKFMDILKDEAIKDEDPNPLKILLKRP